MGNGSVGMGNCLFKLEIGRVSEPTKDILSIFFSTVIYGKPFIIIYLHIGEVLYGFLYKFYPLFEREHIVLLGILPNSDDELVEKGYSAYYNIIMS